MELPKHCPFCFQNQVRWAEFRMVQGVSYLYDEGELKREEGVITTTAYCTRCGEPIGSE